MSWETSLIDAVCVRCGMDFQFPTNYLKRAYDVTRCRDCKAKPAQSCKSDIMPTPCIPWSGEVNDDFYPVKNGKLHKPGNRLCGHKDCVNSNHIEAAS